MTAGLVAWLMVDDAGIAARDGVVLRRARSPLAFALHRTVLLLLREQVIQQLSGSAR
jgi:hypothetical protein